jgi:putative membrane protein
MIGMQAVNNLREETERIVDPRVDLAVQRTELALDRTQLAWARTVIGLMGAGIAVDKGFKFLHQARVLSGEALVRNGHAMGLTLTAISTLLLAIVSWDYLKNARWLASLKRSPSRRLPSALVVSVMVVVLGGIVFAVLLADPSR